RRILRAVENPYTTILGHMTGRLLLRRPGYEINVERILVTCGAHGVAVEINANPRRLDLDWRGISAPETPPFRAISTPQWVSSISSVEWASGLMLITQQSSSETPSAIEPMPRKADPDHPSRYGS